MDNQQWVQLFALLGSNLKVSAISTAAKFNLADKLKDGPKSVHMLAQETGTHEASLYRLLRALASIGIFTEVQPYCFKNTELSSLLLSDHPGFLRDAAYAFGSEIFWRSAGALDYSVKTGAIAFEHVFGESSQSYMATHPDEAEIFLRSMAAMTHLDDTSVLQAYDFSVFETIVDVGGGHGELLTRILHNYPNVRGILFDTEMTIEQAREHLSSELRERGELVEGNFFESVPAGGDAYILKHVLHNWSDEECITILKNCRQAMKPTGRVLAVDRIMPETYDPARSWMFFMDLNMLVQLGGHERSQERSRQLYEAAGLELTRLIHSGDLGLAIVEGIVRA